MNMEKVKLFIVEDDEFALEVMKDSFSDIGQLEVKGFATVEECLSCLNEKPPIIVLDYNLNKNNHDAMDGGRGLELILKELPSAKVIMLTGQEDLETAERLMKNGAYYYISKDATSMDKLKRKIRLILSFMN